MLKRTNGYINHLIEQMTLDEKIGAVLTLALPGQFPAAISMSLLKNITAAAFASPAI